MRLYYDVDFSHSGFYCNAIKFYWICSKFYVVLYVYIGDDEGDS